jgi:uncharacterized protein (DUF1800 family)
MAISGVEVGSFTDLELMSHLYRRAGFGASREDLEAALAKGYEATVDELVHPERVEPLDEDLIFRYYPDSLESRVLDSTQMYWVYRMINTPRPLEEKMTLFWHGLFATGNAKVSHARTMYNQMNMFRRVCLADFRTILVELSRDPAMIFWLDNQENTNDVHNENYGRELLELFSMGRGNYTEDDVKNCARAFTGWGLKNVIPSPQPYGMHDRGFQFRPEQHDDDEKEFLGERGNFDGTDIIDIIVRQPATAQFIARRLHNFFVSDVPNPDAINELAEVYRQSNYDIRAVVRALFLSEHFRSPKAYYARVKSPVEHVVGIKRLVEDFTYPQWGIRELALECAYMGQELLNPPSVEGWHTGKEWIDTGILVERVNFAAEQIGDTTKPGIRKIVERLRAMGDLSPEEFVEQCLDLLGPLPVKDQTYAALVDHSRLGGPLRFSVDGRAAEQRVSKLLQLIVATREFQLC